MMGWWAGMAVTYFGVLKAAKQGTCLLSLLHQHCAHGRARDRSTGVGGGRRLQQAPSGSSLLRPWAHPHLALCDGVPHVAGWSPALGAAATGGGDWMPGEPVPPKVRLVSRCKSEVDTQNKPP